MTTIEVIPVYVPEFMPDFEEMEERHMYISKKYHTAIHKCLCGCGLKTVMPLIAGEWTITEGTDGKVSFTPSILNSKDNGLCGAHYVIINNIAIID